MLMKSLLVTISKSVNDVLDERDVEFAMYLLVYCVSVCFTDDANELFLTALYHQFV